MRACLRLLTLVVFFVAPAYPGWCQEDEKIFDRAVESAREGDADSAFMSLHTLVSSYPDSPHAQDALFSIGAYYFDIGDLQDASRTFFNILKEYPAFRARLFCYAYLLEIAKKGKKDSQIKALEYGLIDARRLIFVFTESKEYSYTSITGTAYKAVYRIDKVDIYAHGTLFTSVSY
jgi:hypothetical protein